MIPYKTILVPDDNFSCDINYHQDWIEHWNYVLCWSQIGVPILFSFLVLPSSFSDWMLKPESHLANSVAYHLSGQPNQEPELSFIHLWILFPVQPPHPIFTREKFSICTSHHLRQRWLRASNITQQAVNIQSGHQGITQTHRFALQERIEHCKMCASLPEPAEAYYPFLEKKELLWVLWWSHVGLINWATFRPPPHSYFNTRSKMQLVKPGDN